MNSHKKYDWATIRQGGFLRYVSTYGLQAGLLFASLMTIVNYFAASRLQLLADLHHTLTDVLLRYVIYGLWFGSVMSVLTWWQNEKNFAESSLTKEDSE